MQSYFLCGARGGWTLAENQRVRAKTLPKLSFLFKFHNRGKRVGDDREFFYLTPEEALEQMKDVAEILDAYVVQYDNNGKPKTKIFDYRK